MKNLKLRMLALNASEVLTREQMKSVRGGDGSGARCSNDRMCSVYNAGDGGCKQMGTGQCRCVLYHNGSASESVPDSICLL